MAHSRGFTRGRGVVSSRRKTGWNEGPFSTILSLAAAGSTAWSTGQQSLLDGQTIVRLRGEFSYSIVAAASANDGFDAMAVGVCIISENAQGIGVTATPQPLSDIGWDGWLYHRLVTGIKALTTDAGETWGNAGSAQGRVEIDSKAMRKFRATDVIVGVVEMGTEVGAATVHFHARTRMLFKVA